MNDPIYWQLILQVVLIFLNAIFACAEIAVISMNDNKLAQMAEQGDKRAIRLAELTSQPARFLATIQVAITLSGFLGSAFAADNFSDKLVGILVNMGVAIPEATLDTISVIAITLILSYFTLVFGELVPKRLAMRKAEQLALGMSALISFFSKAFAPLVWVLTASTNGILRLCGIDPDAEDETISEEEIRMMVDIGNQKGVIDSTEQTIIQNVFSFDDLAVREFATRRTELALLWTDETPEEWEKIICESRYARYPVCDDTIDHIVGVLSVKDYFRLKDKSMDSLMKNAVHQPYFVPESIYADVLMGQMKRTHNHFAIVLDEYGGLFGVVTMNDLLEQLVGELEDEAPDFALSPKIQQTAPDTWCIEGSMDLQELAKMLNISLPTEDYETFSGYVFGNYGSIPCDGSTFDLDMDGLHITVKKIKEHCIESAVIRLNAMETKQS